MIDYTQDRMAIVTHTYYICVSCTADPVTPNIYKNEHEFVNVTHYTVILEWTAEGNVSYNVSVTPMPEVVFIKDTVRRIIGNYNTSYNVSIVATLCRKRTTASIAILEYGKFY